MQVLNCHGVRTDALARLKCPSMNPAFVSVPKPDFTTFPVLSLMWADHWSFLTRLRVVVGDAEAHEFITIYHPHVRRPTWLIKPLEDGVAMCCGANDYPQEYVFPNLRTALLSIRRLTPAKKKADRAVAKGLPPTWP
jgi:hypothetical protein